MDSITNNKSVFEPNKPTIDDQIAFMKNSRHSILGSDDAIYTAIIENLKAIKRWNETPVYHGKVDVEKVIEDLLFYAKYYADDSSAASAFGMEAKDHVDNAEAALGMLQAFKEEREAGMSPRDLDVLRKFNSKKDITDEDVEKTHKAGKKILDRKKWETYPFVPQTERDALAYDVATMLPNFSNTVDTSAVMTDNKRVANAIIFAIERMDDLKRKHGK